MKTRWFIVSRCLFGILPLIASPRLRAAPLTWFPGPPLDGSVSGAATVVNHGANLVIGGDSFSVRQLAATNVDWTYALSFFNATYAAGAVNTGGLIIFYGGNDGEASTSTVIGYSTTDSAIVLDSMSVPRSYLGYASDRDGNPYAIGGLDGDGQPLSSVERYDMDLNTWSFIASLPSASYDFPAAFDRTNAIYIFGGRTNTTVGSETTTVLRYSVSGNTWTYRAPMPVAVAGSAAAWGPDGKVYVVGGVSAGMTTNLVQVYDPVADSWTLSTPLPESLSGTTIGVDSLGRLIVIGGLDAGNDVSDVWRSQQLTAPDTPPVFVSYPDISAAYQMPYVSSINATGNPQPTFLLLSGPDGMVVDPYSGAIAWTPQASEIGSNSVTIRATNYAGFADWNFTIPVPNPPPTTPTNLTLVGVTDNSVTISWNPESPVVGPTTYRVYLKHVLHDPRGSGATIWYTQIGETVTVPIITITGLTPGLGQTYYVAASAPGGTTGYGSGIHATTTSPQGPPALFVTEITSTSVSLAWLPAPGPDQNPLYSAITSYTIMERNVSVSPAANVPTVTNITGTNGTITGLTAGRSHIWFVSGVDAAGNFSPLTSVYLIVTNPIPTSPIINSAGLSSNGDFQLSITEGGSSLQTVVIQATTNPLDPNSWVQIGSVLPSSNPFTFHDPSAPQYPIRFYRLMVP